MAAIQLIFNGQIKQTYELNKAEFTIGRKESNDIFIDNKSVSSRHAVIIRKDNDYIIRDLDSTNGTKVNGKKIKTVKLNDGDHISLFKYTLSFSVGENNLDSSMQGSDTHGSNSFVVDDDATVMLNASQINNMVAEYKADEATEDAAHAARIEVTTADEISTIAIGTNPIIIGRNSRCKVLTGGWPFFTPAISAVIKKDMSGTYSIKPETTIRLNGAKINHKQLLKTNDRILIRNTLIVFLMG